MSVSRWPGSKEQTFETARRAFVRSHAKDFPDLDSKEIKDALRATSNPDELADYLAEALRLRHESKIEDS